MSSAATDHQPSEAAAERSLGPYRLPLATAVLSGSAVRPAASTARASFGLRKHKLLLKEKAPTHQQTKRLCCRSVEERSVGRRTAQLPPQVLIRIQRDNSCPPFGGRTVSKSDLVPLLCASVCSRLARSRGLSRLCACLAGAGGGELVTVSHRTTLILTASDTCTIAS